MISTRSSAREVEYLKPLTWASRVPVSFLPRPPNGGLIQTSLSLICFVLLLACWSFSWVTRVALSALSDSLEATCLLNVFDLLHNFTAMPWILRACPPLHQRRCSPSDSHCGVPLDAIDLYLHTAKLMQRLSLLVCCNLDAFFFLSFCYLSGSGIQSIF